MRVRPVLTAAVAAVLLAAPPPSRAADIVLLGGIGTSTARFSDDAPAMTLKGPLADDAPVESVHLVRRLAFGVAYGVTHPFGGYYRPYYAGFYRPYAYRPYYSGF